MALQQIDHGPVRELRLDRPPVNALNPELVNEIKQAVEQSAATCRALVISGREGLFSAGLDVPELLQLDHEGMTGFWRRFFGLLEAIARSPIPVCAALTGHAPAGGAVVSIFCDSRIMSRGDFKIGLNETRVGLVVPFVIKQALVRLTGPARAERLIVAGQMLSPETALAASIVDSLADDPAGTVTDAIDWCNNLLELPSHAMLGNRAMLRRDLHAQFDALGEKDISDFVDFWFRKDTQQSLHELLARLKGG